MGIRFYCPACSKKVHVKDHQAGLRGFCPKCGSKIDIPQTSTRESSKKRRRDDAVADAEIALIDEASPVGAGNRVDERQLVDDMPRKLGIVPRPRDDLSNDVDRESTLNVVLPRTGRLISVSSKQPVDPLDEDPKKQWYVVPPTGTEPFGPADGTTMRQWIAEGRVAVQSLVWREDWPEWRKAGTVWSQLVVEQARKESAESRR